ncbi:1-acyl-sn-glycerol-3-phosphate acyltransferase [Candidatus Poribacteria bacterium]|nr:1-acyl-sn-glycerol-3-phosphate acyltransferase [Candidatus Poribacteria bacterium]
MLDFRPSKENPLVIWAARWMLPFIMRFFLKVFEVDIDSESLKRLKSTHGFATVLVPNHVTDADPYVMFALSKRIGERFRYMTAQESFYTHAGGRLRGFFLQRLGCYSVVRGAVDRESFRMTREILTKGEQKLVVFAEGEISHQNDTVMPFESGVVQLCFWAMDDMKKTGEVKPVYLVPVAIKYAYQKEMWGEIGKGVTTLERKILPKHSSPPEDLYDRLRNVGAILVGTLAKEYQLRLSENDSLNERIQQLREHILSQIEDFMEIVPQPESTPLKRVRTIRNRIDEEVYREVDEMTAYEKEIHEQRLDTFRQFYIDLNRVINFIAIYDGYVREKPSPERFLEVIARLEIEVFGRSKPKGPITAFLRVGTPKNLLDVYETYKKEKRHITQQVTLELETAVQNLISGLSH